MLQDMNEICNLVLVLSLGSLILCFSIVSISMSFIVLIARAQVTKLKSTTKLLLMLW